jgi:hypothetical protein
MVFYHSTTLHHNPEDHNLKHHHPESLITPKKIYCFTFRTALAVTKGLAPAPSIEQLLSQTVKCVTKVTKV